MKRIVLTGAAFFVLALLNTSFAQRAIKLATVVPDGSIWDKNLKQMAEEWKEATGGRVTITVFSGASLFCWRSGG